METGEQRTGLTVFHLTDVHGRADAEVAASGGAAVAIERIAFRRGEGRLGIAALESLLVDQRARCGDRPILFVHCGDLVSIERDHARTGDGLLTLTTLEALLERADISRCYAVVGNHEIDRGVDVFQRLAERAKRTTFVCGNLAIDGHFVSDGVVRVETGGLRIGLVSLTVEATCADAPQPDRSRLVVEPPVPAGRSAAAEARRLREKGELDLTIGVVHLDDPADAEIAENAGLDLLLGGHTHRFVGRRVGSRSLFVSKAGCYARYLGVAEIATEDGGARVIDERSWLIPPVAVPGADQSVQRHYEDTRRRLAGSPGDETPVARLDGPIGSVLRVRSSDQPIGRLVARTILGVAREISPQPVNAAFINGGNVRNDLAAADGLLRAEDLRQVVPWNNEIVVVEVARELFELALLNGVACAKVEPQGFLQVAGARLEVTARGELRDVFVEAPDATGRYGEAALAELDTVRVATIDYLVRDGGHHFGFLSEGEVVATGKGLCDAWVDTLRTGAPPLPVIRAPLGPGLRLDANFRLTEPDDVLRNVDRAGRGGLEWVRERLRRAEDR